MRVIGSNGTESHYSTFVSNRANWVLNARRLVVFDTRTSKRYGELLGIGSELP